MTKFATFELNLTQQPEVSKHSYLFQQEQLRNIIITSWTLRFKF